MRDLLAYFGDLIRILLELDPQADLVREPSVGERDNHYGDLSFSVAYRDGSQLHVQLQADCSSDPILWGDYGFQYVGPGEELRFRYDNAPHRHGLPNFPHHLHLSSGEVLSDGPPTARIVARAIRWHFDHPGRPWRPGG